MSGETAATIACPCEEFASNIGSIRTALDSEEQAHILIEWLSGNLDQTAFKERRSLSCGSFCTKRVKASLLILNAIRDACRPFLETVESPGAKKKDATPKKEGVSYEEAFPSLSSSNSTSKENVKKPKRRIRPATLETQAWGSNVARKGNLVNLPSSEPLVPDDRLLRISISSKATTQSSNLTPRKQSTSAEDIVTPNKAKFSSLKESRDKFNTPRKAEPVWEETEKEVATSIQMKNLIDVYCTLIENCLVPSTALELHLLIRLLTATSDNEPSLILASELSSILSSPVRCKFFGAQSLAKLSFIFRGMAGLALLEELVRCPPFRTQLPEPIVRELESFLEELTHSARTDPALTITTRNQTPILTLPFKEQRDSRHNFRTREEQALYKNREESRDGFLYQLRSFLNFRGKLVDASRAENAINKIRLSSRVVVDGVMDSNLPWFSEFFCDLMLQIGLVPLEETDKDLLRITNKEKLQKLHRRFSSRSSQASKSTRKLVAERKMESSSSPVAEAQQYFPGHQEFFFLFLLSADSYRLGVHLKSRMISILKALASQMSAQDLDKRLMDMCLIARFVGVLLFSPNWRPYGLRSHHMPADGLNQLAASGLSLIDAVENAWKTSSLVSVVPWVVEILKLTTWDKATRDSLVYDRLAGLLRQIQLRIYKPDSTRKMASQSRLLVAFSLETLFDETDGMAGTCSRPLIALPSDFPIADTDAVDRANVFFSTAAFFACNPHVEELSALVAKVSRADFSSLRSPGASRKLRPLVVAASPTTDSFEKKGDLMTNEAKDRSSVKYPFSVNNKNPILSKLQDTFFHQHQDLKDTCEFVVNRVLRNALSRLSSECIWPLLKEYPASTDNGCASLEKDVTVACRSFLKRILEDSVSQALHVLVDPAADEKIVEIAASIAVSYGMQTGEAMLKELVSSELRSTQAMANGKRLFTNESAAKTSSDPTQGRLGSIITAVNNLRQEMDRSRGGYGHIAYLLHHMLDDLPSLQDESRIPGEAELRPFFESIFLLDNHSRSLLDWALSSYSSGADTAEVRWSVLSAYLRLAVKIKSWSRHGLRYVDKFLSSEASLSAIIDLGLAAQESFDLAALLVDMVNTRLIKMSKLEDSLLKTVEDVAEGNTDLLQHCLDLIESHSLSDTMKRLRDAIA